MNSKLFIAVVTIASFFLSSTAAPTKIQSASRQAGFVFATAAAAPATVSTDTAAAAPAPAEPEPEMLPAVMAEPEASAEAEAETATGEMVEVAYNIGGDAVGKFEADPVDWIIGETAHFEIETAEIVADPEIADIYKSHRYGLVGSTWGYDFAFDTAGVYDCTLHYAETYDQFFTEEPNRTFRVQISGDGAPLDIKEAEFDVMVELGGAEFTGYTRTFTDISVSTTLVLRETPVLGDAFLSGINCTYTGAL